MAETAGRRAKEVAKRGRPGKEGTDGPNHEELASLPEALKVAYIKTLVWLIFQDDSKIDDREAAEIHLLMAQIDCDRESRSQFRHFIADSADLEVERCVQELVTCAPYGKKDAVCGALLKDAIRIHLATSAAPAREAKGVKRLANEASMTAEQMATFEDIYDKERQMTDQETSDKKILALTGEIAAAATGVGVPVTAVYLTGSVTGLSAAGISSGLAGIGLGGLFGLSAMATGVGAAVGGGVVAYKAARWLTHGRSRARSVRLRGLLLQEILRNHQRALANMAEDIGCLADKLVRLTENTEVNQLRLTRLAQEITLFRGAFGELRARESRLEAELQREQETRKAEEPDEEETESSGEEPARPANGDSDGSETET